MNRACLILAALGLVTLTGCDAATPKVPGADQRSAKDTLANARRLKRACGSAETYDRLKAFAFDEAAKISRGGSPLLDRIAANATVRMENPVAKSRDEALDVTVCEGHLVLDLPPGLVDAFDGDRRLEADVEYAAQAAVDGSGLVYQMQGAEPIIYRLAALTLPGGRSPTQMASPASAPAPIAHVPPIEQAPVAQAPAPAQAPVQAPVQAPQPAPVVAEAATTPARPSFRCKSARSRVERMICAQPSLAAQDRRMSSAFYAALASGDGETRAQLRASRDRFLRARDGCGDAACVARSYDARVAEIARIAGR